MLLWTVKAVHLLSCTTLAVSALGHASGRARAVVSEPAWQAVRVDSIVLQELVNPGKGGAIINTVHGRSSRMVHLWQRERDFLRVTQRYQLANQYDLEVLAHSFSKHSQYK